MPVLQMVLQNFPRQKLMQNRLMPAATRRPVVAVITHTGITHSYGDHSFIRGSLIRARITRNRVGRPSWYRREQFPDLRYQSREVDRLRMIIVAPGPQRLRAILDGGISGQGNNRDLGAARVSL